MVARDGVDILAGQRNCSPFLDEVQMMEDSVIALENESFTKHLCFKLGDHCLFLSPMQFWPNKSCPSDRFVGFLGGECICHSFALCRNKHITVTQAFHKHPIGFSLSASSVFGKLKYSGVALAAAGAVSMQVRSKKKKKKTLVDLDLDLLKKSFISIHLLRPTVG